MRTFEIYVDDDRYTVPTLHIATLADEDAALAVAARLLAESEHHRGVEICEDGLPLAVLASEGLEWPSARADTAAPSSRQTGIGAASSAALNNAERRP